MHKRKSKEHKDMITQKNQLNEPFQDKNLRKIWPNYPQGKKSTNRESKF